MADPIAPIAAGVIRPIAPIGADRRADVPGFVDLLNGTVGEINEARRSAEQAARAYAAGKVADATAIVLSMEHASITLALMLQVRSRLLEAYQDIQRIQV